MPDEPEDNLVWMIPSTLVEEIDQCAKDRGLSTPQALEEMVRLGLKEHKREQGRLSVIRAMESGPRLS
jgi:metal-responsive CopG/Arc/MetJ family transcriptional regulator